MLLNETKTVITTISTVKWPAKYTEQHTVI